MKSIQVHIPALLKKIQEMSNDKMECVTLSICDEAIDQNIYSPAFLHFEAYTGEALITDYESIEAINIYSNSLERDRAV